MMRNAYYVAVYDMSDDRERARVEKCLLGYGIRVQKSVFELILRKPQHQKLLADLQKLKLTSGFVRVYRCLSGVAAVDIGVRPAPDPDTQEVWFV